MSGDYSRDRFGPKNNYSGVRMQQGRVQLDSDWNEWADVLDRRTRAETVDTFGVAGITGIGGVAVVSPQTPGGFFIQVSDGTFTIGQGRMYVDGLLAENFGDDDGPQVFDPLLAEEYGLNPVAYESQPYYPDPASLPGGGPHLAYLEVWQREVTHLQRPDMVEKAVSVDTTTRSQTVWQVRLLENVASDIDCTSPDSELAAAWADIINPSAGRLSSKAVGVSGDDDPCELPPSGGYRGLENQLYRIEIHDGGTVGSATFKWSRDNASVAAAVVEVISATELKLATLGRDAVLRFNTGDWVEIVDDWRELSGEASDPTRRFGEMRQIIVDDAGRTITFSPALPPGLIPTEVGDNTLEARHLRVIRWDQKRDVRDDGDNLLVDLDDPASGGVIPVPPAGVWVHLENGVQVRFDVSPAGGDFHCNDYWTVAARTSDAPMEILTDAPPRGIHRHYARLALVTFPDGEADCREHWPPECGGGCCDITVSPGEDIQGAINSLPEEGGCVCLRTGVHEISAPLEIHNSRIRLHGESPGAVVRDNTGLEYMLEIGSGNLGVSDIVVEDLRFEAVAPRDERVLLYIHNCREVTVSRCVLTASQQLTASMGILMQEVADVVIGGNSMENLMIGIWISEFHGAMVIEDNIIEGLLFQVTDVQEFSISPYGVWVNSDVEAACRIEHNRFDDFQIAVWLGDGARYSRVAHNEIWREGELPIGPMPANTEELRAYLGSSLYGIVVEAENCLIEQNRIDLPGGFWGGIRTRASHTEILGNHLLAGSGNVAAVSVPASIYCYGQENSGRAADYSRIAENTLSGSQAGIVISRVEHVVVEDNIIDGTGTGWFGVRVDDCVGSRVCANRIEDVFFALFHSAGEENTICRNDISRCGMGISSLRENHLDINHNSVSGCLISGILLEVLASANIGNNRISHCGYSGFASLGIGVLAERIILESEALVRIEGNEVLDTGVDPVTGEARVMPAIGIGGLCPACQVSHNRTGYTQNVLDPQREHRALLLIGPMAIQVGDMGGVMFGSGVVTDNHFRGPGRRYLVEFMRWPVNRAIDFRFEKVTFSNNVCDHLQTEILEDGATVGLLGSKLIAMGNHIKAGPDVNSMSLGNRARSSLMGNITTGGFIRVGTITPAPLTDYNIRT